MMAWEMSMSLHGVEIFFFDAIHGKDIYLVLGTDNRWYVKTFNDDNDDELFTHVENPFHYLAEAMKGYYER